MKKLVLLTLIISFLLPTVSGNTSEKMMVFSYKQPYRYELKNGTYKVLAIIKNINSVNHTEVSFNGELLPLKKLKSGSVQIWLPLIGKPGVLEITQKEKKKKIVRKQHFEPLIPADWDYFGNGKIHVIVSSHQDIG